MTGAQVEHVRAGVLAITEEERRWDHLIKKAHVYANGTMVPKEMVGKPDVVFAGMLMCLRLGFSEDAVTQVHVIEGRLDSPAHMYLGALHLAGYETRWLRTDNEAAVIEVTYPNGDTLPVEFTIDDARRAGLLDEWVEHWISFTDSNNTKRNKLEKFVLGRDGVDTPEWAADLVRAGKTKRMDNWHKWTADMLASKAAKRLTRRVAPEVLFGIADEIRRAVPAAEVTVDDDDPVDGEIVEDPPGGPSVADPPVGDSAAGSGRRPPPADPAVQRPLGYPPPIEEQATPLERRVLMAMIDRLPPKARAALNAEATAAHIPSVKGPRFTHDHAAQLLELTLPHLDTPRPAPQGSQPSDAAAADGAVPSAAPSASTPQYRPGEEPFE